jgi:uncharacterized membrane protein YqaE (UPF0057 family)
MDLLRIIAAIFVPPLGVFMQERFSKRFWINVVLTMLGYIPGILHAVYVILKYEPRALPRSRTAGQLQHPSRRGNPLLGR